MVNQQVKLRVDAIESLAERKGQDRVVGREHRDRGPKDAPPTGRTVAPPSNRTASRRVLVQISDWEPLGRVYLVDQE
jgi:hypothetical protein